MNPHAYQRSSTYIEEIESEMRYRTHRACLALALLFVAQSALAAPPARYAGKIISRRVRHFPPKVVALTFDDGPSSEITPQVLDALARLPCERQRSSFSGQW